MLENIIVALILSFISGIVSSCITLAVIKTEISWIKEAIIIISKRVYNLETGQKIK